jgi:hypothetical protein
MRVTFDAEGLAREKASAERLPARYRKRAWAAVRVASFKLERQVKLRMPVDTGRARASWGHHPSEGVWDEDEPALAITQGSRVEYVQYLNEGHSSQAPAGVIDAEEMLVKEWLANELAEALSDEWGA